MMASLNSMAEALELAHEHHPPLAIVDFYMPGGNGDELTRALHNDPATASTVVAIHSQFPDVVKKALKAGAVELIGKEDPQDLFLMRVDALKTMVEAQTYQRNIERLLEESKLEERPVTILMVDDSPTVRAVYGNYLRNDGFQVLEASTLQQGREIAQAEQPDMMLVDFILPDGHGDELVRDLLGQISTANILMVMFSNKEDLEEVALGAGAVDIISKDDPLDIFMRRVQSMRRYVESQRQQQQLMLESKRKLAEQERFFNGISSSMVEGLYALDLHGDVTYINQTGLELIGYSKKEVIGQNMHELIHANQPDGLYLPEAECPVHLAIRQNRQYRVESDWFQHKAGHHFPVEFSSAPLTDEGGGAARLGCTVPRHHETVST